MKLHTHMMLSMAFVPPDHVACAFAALKPAASPELDKLLDYFNNYYVTD